MKSSIVLLDNKKDYSWQFKRMIDSSAGQMMINTLKASGVDSVYLVSDQTITVDDAKVVADLFDAIKDINQVDVEILLLNDIYPNLKKETVEALFAEDYTRIKGTKNIKLHIKDLAKIKDIKFKDVDTDGEELTSINDHEQFSAFKKQLKQNIIARHVANGVNFIDEEQVYIGKEVKIAKGATIEANVSLFGKTEIGADTLIGSGSYLENAVIGNECKILASRITDSKMGNKVTCGPWSHLRNGCEVHDNVRIGNFVEFKNTVFGHKSRCAHLTYLGDSEVGEDVNIGCGVVTVNYDGKNKYHTKIGDHAFIGSNANLIAPIKIGDYALVAAGSTVNCDVEDGAMGIARTRQSNKEGYGYQYIKKEKK